MSSGTKKKIAYFVGMIFLGVGAGLGACFGVGLGGDPSVGIGLGVFAFGVIAGVIRNCRAENTGAKEENTPSKREEDDPRSLSEVLRDKKWGVTDDPRQNNGSAAELLFAKDQVAIRFRESVSERVDLEDVEQEARKALFAAFDQCKPKLTEDPSELDLRRAQARQAVDRKEVLEAQARLELERKSSEINRRLNPRGQQLQIGCLTELLLRRDAKDQSQSLSGAIPELPLYDGVRNIAERMHVATVGQLRQRLGCTKRKLDEIGIGALATRLIGTEYLLAGL
jgi:hypothetical protein